MGRKKEATPQAEDPELEYEVEEIVGHKVSILQLLSLYHSIQAYSLFLASPSLSLAYEPLSFLHS